MSQKTLVIALKVEEDSEDKEAVEEAKVKEEPGEEPMVKKDLKEEEVEVLIEVPGEVIEE